MAASAVYAGDRPSASGETEFPSDPAAGGFFATEFRKHEDLKHMLDSNKDGLKLEAMKRIIGMVAKGKDASDLFPAVVKNVVSKNIEVKKLVYVYLVRYAEEQQDLALLSISTFQRALKDPNQLIRASALRVLSSIRVPVIVPIMMLAIKDAVNDMSPYVRKTAAHAIPKLYSLDAEQKDQLIEVIEKLLSDKTTLVMGSAVMAFEEVCPEKIELIHKNYRKLCNLLVDVEEWGQVIIMNMLTRYARTQFADPNEHEGAEITESKTFYESENSESNNEEKGKKTFVMDPDHRLLLRNCKPLLQSRNSSVVMSVVQLYYYLAPRSEMNIIAKALIRLIHSHREIQSVVLSNIATLSTKHKGMFEPYIKSFFVRSSDPTHIKILKLEILTNLASESNVSFILREFQTYVSSPDMEFVAATIQAIGRCASSMSEVTDTCLNGLVSLLSNRNETVVAESVVVIKKLLQMKITDHKDIIVHMSRLMDNITIPMARASILWLLGEYADKVTKIAPDVLRKVAKNFVNEEEIVKLQAITLAAKLYLTNPKQTKLLTQYVFNLAKYDQNYDIRDRTRFLRQLTMPQGEKVSQLSKYAKKILLTSKPAPVLQSKFKDRDRFQLGSLSHYINSQATGYHDLPLFPETVPDPTVRNVEAQPAWQEHQLVLRKQKSSKKKSFYSETETSSGEEDESGSSAAEGSDKSKEAKTPRKHATGDESSEEESGSSEEESDGEESSSEEESSSGGVEKAKVKVAGAKAAKPQKKETTSEESESDNSEGEESESPSSEEESEEEVKPKTKKVGHIKKVKAEPPKKSVDLLLDLDDFSSGLSPAPVFQPSPFSNVLTPSANNNELEKMTSPTEIITSTVSAAFVPTIKYELLNRYSGKGLVVEYRFTRTPNLYSGKMTTIELTLKNTTQDTIGDVHVPDKKMGSLEVKGFSENLNIAANSVAVATIAIDYNESTQPAIFELKSSKHSFSLSIKAPVGEIIQPVLLSEGEFIAQQSKLKGMNENSMTVDLSSGQSEMNALIQNVYEVANVMQVQNIQNNSNITRFASITPSTRTLVLVSVQVLSNAKAVVTINCDKMVIGSMLLKELKQALVK